MSETGFENATTDQSCALYFPGTASAMRPFTYIHVVVDEGLSTLTAYGQHGRVRPAKKPLLAGESSHFVLGSTRTKRGLLTGRGSLNGTPSPTATWAENIFSELQKC